MAYLSNAFVRRNSGNKFTIHLIYDDTEGLFKDMPDEGFVMARTEDVSGSPMIVLNGEKYEGDSWLRKIDGDLEAENGALKSIWGYTVSQLSTCPIWVCRKVANLFT